MADSELMMVTCPSCGHQFPAEKAFRDQLEHKIRAEAESRITENLTRKHKDDIQRAQEEIERKAKEDMEKIKSEGIIKFQEAERRAKEEREKAVQENLEKLRVAEDQIRQAREEAARKESESGQREEEVKRLKADAEAVRAERLSVAKKEQELAARQSDMEIERTRWQAEQRTLMAKEVNSKAEEISRQALEREKAEQDAKMKAKDDEMRGLKDKIQQLQKTSESNEAIRIGEGQEQDIQEKLQQRFKWDEISEVVRGANGADVLQIVMQDMRRAGVIYWESKYTDTFQAAYVEKLRSDMQSKSADIGILVSRTFPADKKSEAYFIVDERLIVVRPYLFLFIADLVRQQILKVEVQKGISQQRPEMAQRVYDYITGADFQETMKESVKWIQALHERNELDYRATVQSFIEKREMIQRLGHTILVMGTTAFSSAGIGIPSDLDAIKGLPLSTLPLPESKIKGKPGRKPAPGELF